MPRFRIEIDGDNEGHVGWQFTAVHYGKDDGDNDTNKFIAITKVLNETTHKLEEINSSTE